MALPFFAKNQEPIVLPGKIPTQGLKIWGMIYHTGNCHPQKRNQDRVGQIQRPFDEAAPVFEQSWQ
jgi:hypothetical protein